MHETYKAIKRLVEEMNLIMRGGTGYGSGQPWAPRHKAKGLGKSFVEEFVEEYGDSSSGDDGERSPEKFQVSKVFRENNRNSS